MKKHIALIALVILMALVLTACNQLDVIGNGSVRAFSALLDSAPDQVATVDSLPGFSLSAPDGSARFVWSRDYSASDRDVYIEFDAQPFIDAGMDVGKLPNGMLQGDKIVIGTSLEEAASDLTGEATPLAAFEQIERLSRDHIKYHADLDHFGVSLESGNMLEWAKDMAANDKDMVFALNPQPFIDAGADPERIEGWVFAKVNAMDGKRKVTVDKLLKPFDID